MRNDELSIKLVSRTLAALALLMVGAGGCRTLERIGDRERFGRALGNALQAKTVIVPAVGAAVFSIGNLDERTSDWAADHTPVFGSARTAEDISNYGVEILRLETIATAFIAPGVEEGKLYSRLERPGVEYLSWVAVVRTTDSLKSAVGRERPDGSDNRSFPSGHASQAFSLATLSNRNLGYIDGINLGGFGSIDLSDESRGCLQFGNLLVASAVGWGRVEGREHYPSDVLGGAAIGNFLSIFIHDWLIGEAGEDDVAFLVVPMRGGGIVQLGFRF
jgi:membrane-associated phospholipid phosphatase